MREQTLGERKARILRAIIEDYILTAMPVGSRTVSRKYETSLSSATIRNEMSDLEEAGFLSQPHVSAGRVPSLKAYRLYVDDLLENMPEDAEQQALFSGRTFHAEDAVREMAQVLCETTHYTSFVMMPKQLELRVSCLQLVPMPRGEALLVIITDTGTVKDTVIRVSEQLDGDALYAISRMLTERLGGKTLQEVQDMLDVYARQTGVRAEVLEGIAALASEMERQSEKDTVLVVGAHNILSFPEYADVDKARAFLSAVEQKDELMRLISPLNAPFSVLMGPETGLQDCAVVTARYRVAGGYTGIIGVIGPVRMAYENVLNALSGASTALSNMLS